LEICFESPGVTEWLRAIAAAALHDLVRECKPHDVLPARKSG